MPGLDRPNTRAGQARKLVHKSTNSQLRTSEKSCQHADFGSLNYRLAELRSIFNFSPQFRKFYANIEAPFYFGKIFMFLHSQT